MANLVTELGRFIHDGKILKPKESSNKKDNNIDNTQFYDYINYKGLFSKTVELASGYHLVGPDFKKLDTNKLTKGKYYIIKQSFVDIFWGTRNQRYKNYIIRANGKISLNVNEDMFESFIRAADKYSSYSGIHERCNEVINNYISQRLIDCAMDFEIVDREIININLRNTNDQNKSILNSQFNKYGLEILDFTINHFEKILIEE